MSIFGNYGDMHEWQKVYYAVATETMPPPKKKALQASEIGLILNSIKSMAVKDVPLTNRLLTPAELKYTLLDLFSQDASALCDV